MVTIPYKFEPKVAVTIKKLTERIIKGMAVTKR